MIRMLREDDEFSFLWWYNWYITHSVATFETKPLTDREFLDRMHTIREKYPWIVLEDDKQRLGYAYLNSFSPRDAYQWTADVSIYLAPDKCGYGYGRQLMKALIDIARQDGYYNLVSIVTEGNEASMHLHESFGFEKKAFFPNFGYKAGAWHGVTYYVKKLRDPDPQKEPEAPLNLDPFSQPKKNRVPLPE